MKIHRSVLKGHIQFVSLRGLGGMELTFFLATHMVLYFGFVKKKSAGNTPVFWLWLNSSCTVSKLSLFPALPPQQVGWGGQEVGKGQSWDI